MNGIFMNTIQLIGSIVLFTIFLSISYGIFSGTLESMLWICFYSLIEILKPIVAIALLILVAAKSPSWIESLVNSMLEEARADREEIQFWQNMESPTPLNNNQNPNQNTPTDANQAASNNGVGEGGGKLVEMWVDDPNGTGGQKETVERYSARWRELVALQGREYDHKPFIKKSNKEIFMAEKE